MGAEAVIGSLKRAYANFRGFDIEGSTVPPMDGALRPNAALDAAPVAMALSGVDNLTAAPAALLCSVETELLTLEEMSGDPFPGLAIARRQTFDHPVSALASDGGESVAIGLDGCGIVIAGGRHDGTRIEGPGENPFRSVTAIAFAGPDALLVCNGSRQHRAAEWKRDLMTRGASGTVWKVDLSERGTRPAVLADGLRFPTGIAVDGGRALVSEAWRHAVRSVDLGGGPAGTVLSGLPAYPGRIAPASNGGFWLAMFAPRNPLVEFVLKEDAYRRRMIETIDPDYWIAPALVTGRSFLEPIQGGARKKLNMLKPWSPTWSSGLVVRCGPDMRPLASFHSRADGAVHGVTSLCERGGVLLAGAKGSGVIVAIESGRERRLR